MSINSKISVNTHYTRSVNLKRDAGSESVVRSYIPTSRAINTLEVFSSSLKQDVAPRAWSLIGPYGSGKSSFASFLSSLLDKDKSASFKTANEVLSKASKSTAIDFSALTEDNLGYCVVLMTGSPESFGKRLISALHEKAIEIWGSRKGKKPEILQILSHYQAQDESPNFTEIIESIELLQQALLKAGFKGILLAIDELGKFLEYEARHSGTNNIYLLQGLAELALANHPVKFAVVVMLHQSIEQYATGLGATLKNEWAKVQGRFESIPFIDTSEQTLIIVAEAIEHKFNKTELKTIQSKVEHQVDVLIKNGALPSTLDKKSANKVFTSCYPLHPISALILPILCQKVAQNERTLFSYLGSKESHGFVDSLENLSQIGDQVEPWEIYEYFIRNQPISASDHFTYRKWAEVDNALERLGSSDFESEIVLKTIGLLNIIGNQGGLKASNPLLGISFNKKVSLKPSIDSLIENSIVNYRKFNSEYRVWQGSDFDIEIKAGEARTKLGQFSLSEKLNERHNILPVVARKYSIQNGALRYFVPSFASSDSYKELEITSRHPRIIFYLSETEEDKQIFFNDVLNHFNSLDLLVMCPHGEQVREIIGEVLSLEQVAMNSKELSEDPVAQREYKDRYESAKDREFLMLYSLLENPEANDWYRKTVNLEVKNKGSLQNIFSSVLKEVFSSSPIIKNELINRNTPSSQANAARSKLFAALLKDLDKEDLGINKFPAEKSIYRSLLKATGLHIQTKDGKWKLAELSEIKEDNEFNFYPVWKRIDDFINSTENNPKSFIELSQELYAPPFGIKQGVLPILYAVAILSNNDQLAVTEEDVYIPYFSKENVDRFFKRPDLFKIQSIDLGGVNQTIIKEYSSGFFNDNKKRSMLEIAKPFAKFIDDEIPEYTRQTKTGLTQTTRAVRDAFKLSKSPVKLLLEDIPKALGIDSNLNNESSLAELLIEAIKELKYAFPILRQNQADLIAKSFHLNIDPESPFSERLSEMRKSISARCRGLESYTVEEQGQKGFILRTQKTDLDDDSWLDNLLMFTVSKPASKWNDADRIAAEYKLSIIISNIRDLEKLRISHEDSSNENSNAETYMLKSMKIGKENLDEVVVVDEKLHQAAKEMKEKILKTLNEGSGDNKIAIAALAETVDEFLSSKQKNVKNRSKKPINSNSNDKDNSNEVA